MVLHSAKYIAHYAKSQANFTPYKEYFYPNFLIDLQDSKAQLSIIS